MSVSLDVGALYEQHEREIARFVDKRMSGAARPNADDLAQTVWERALKAAGRYDDQGKPKAWLMTIARHLVTDYYKSGHWQRRDIFNALAPFTGDGRVSDFHDSANVARRHALKEPAERDAYPSAYDHLHAALDTLTPEQRRVIVLFYWYGYSFAELAPLAGTTENGAKKLAIRARARMRRYLERAA